MNTSRSKQNMFFAKKILPYISLLFFFLFLLRLQPAGAAITIVRSTAVPENYQVEASQAAACTENYFAAREGLVLDHSVRILLVNGKEEYIAANMKYAAASYPEAIRRAKTTVAWVQGNTIISNIADQSVTRQRVFTIAHELAHHYQGKMAGASTFAILWLTEGAADFWACQVVEQLGYYSVDAYRSGWQNSYKQFAQVPPLPRLAGRKDWYQSLEQYGTSLTYRTADLAVFALTDRCGEASLFRYFKALGTGQPADTAFAESFSITFPDFYQPYFPGVLPAA